MNQSQSTKQSILTVEQKSPQYQQESYRFVNLFVYLFGGFVNSLGNQTFTAINSQVVKLYNVDKLFVGMNTLIFPIVNPICSFFVNGILDKYGLKFGCSVGAILMIIGIWFRLLINTSLWLTLLGSFICAIGNIFIINSPSKFANTWFSHKHVNFVIFLCVLDSMISKALGLIIPAFFVKNDSTKHNIMNLLFVEAIAITIPMILMMIFLRSKPNNPPTKSAAYHNTQNYMKDLKKLFKNKNYVIFLLSFSLSSSLLVTMLADLEYLILPFRFQNPIQFSSGLLFISGVVGSTGSFLFTMILKKYAIYKKIIFISCLGALIQMILFPFSLHTNNIILIYTNMSCLFFFLVPIIPASLQFGCQIVFPIGQASSTGFLLAGNQLVGFTVGTLYLNFLDGVNIWKVYVISGINVVLLIIALILLYFVKQTLKRSNYQVQHEQQQSENRINED